MNDFPSTSESTLSDDRTLLRAWSRSRDEAAFTLFVQRHFTMVRGAALRKTSRPDLAEDVAQTVFALAARRAASLAGHPCAGAWLHRTAVLESANALRREYKQRKIAAAMFVHPDTSPVPGLPEAVLPHLDDALNSLPEPDRRAILLRFGERLSFDQMGTRLGKSANACQKQTNRALDRLRGLLTKHAAVSLTAVAAGLAHTLGTSAAAAAPAACAATAAAAVKQASSLSALTVISNTLATMAFTKLTATAAAVAFLAPIGLHWSSGSAAPPSSPPAPASAQSASPASGPGPRAASRDRNMAAASTRSAALARFAQELAKVTPPPADEQRLAELQRLAFALTEAELPEALQLLRSTAAGSALEKVVAAVAARWAEFDPVTALRMTGSLPKELHASVWSGALQVWARRDFNAAFAWSCQQPDGEDRNSQLDIVYNDLMKRDPAAALTRLKEVPTEAKRKQFRRWTMEVWRCSDPDAAIAWMTDNEPEESREREISQFIHDWGGYRPDLTFSYALKHITNPHLREDTIRWGLMQWGMHDPPAATAAIVNLPPEMQTPEMARNAAPFIAIGDPAAFLEATRQLPEGEFRDTLQIPVINQFAATDIPKARQMMEALSSTTARQQAAGNIGRQWIERDPVAARQWIESSPDLSAEFRKHLLSEIKK